MSQVVTYPIDQVSENPHRQLATYPTIERKVESLMRSLHDVGLWEGIIARPDPTSEGCQIAFGHHRLEAAKRIGLTEIPVILRDLTDEEMLKFMGRENGENYSTEFLIMLNTWEGAIKFRRRDVEKLKPLDLATLLGWTAIKSDNAVRMNETAQACASAHALISGGYMSREDLEGLSVRSAKDIVQRAHSRMEAMEKSAKATNRPHKEVEAAKKSVAKGAKETAKAVKEGAIAQKDIRSEVDVNAYKAAASSKVKNSPLFAAFGHALSETIKKMLSTDGAAKRLEEVTKFIGQVTMDEDRAVLRQIDYELAEVAIRADAWQKRLIPDSEKIVGLPRLEKKGA